MSRKNMCSFCGEMGHNIRGCVYASSAACLVLEVPEVIDLAPSVKKKCSYCNLTGHNIRTCAGYKFVQIRKKETAAITIQKYARRLIVYQTIEFPVDPYLGPYPPDSVSKRKPRTLPETRGVDPTPVDFAQRVVELYTKITPAELEAAYAEVATEFAQRVEEMYADSVREGSPLVLP